MEDIKKLVQQALSKGVEMHKNGKLDLATQLYESVLKIIPRHADAQHNLGIISLDNGNFSEAKAHFRVALEENSNNPQHWISYIDSLLRLFEFDDALDVLRRARKRGLKLNISQ